MTVQPIIIQGGMGVGVSSWRLARAVSQAGQLGVVSGTALDLLLARRLQSGDPGGLMAEAAARFPFPAIVERVWKRYFIEGGKSAAKKFLGVPMHALKPSRDLLDLTVLANFVEVSLAKHGHPGLVGINLLEKIQLPTIPSLFGAMLAGVDYVLMGAGIPRAVPGILDQLALGQAARLKVDVHGAMATEEYFTEFNTEDYLQSPAQQLERPKFLAIVSSATLAIALARKSSGRVDGFVVEGWTAGGHNAPPRGAMQIDAAGEPIYGERDLADLEKIASLGLPYWLAGSFGDQGKIAEAQALGAVGIQVGTAFAFCEESGIDPALKEKVLDGSRRGVLRVFTDPVASPTGFPFKIIQGGPDTTIPVCGEGRTRICDLGYLRHLFRKPDGNVGYRCPSEPVGDYLRKGGLEEETVGRQCVCNGLMSTLGLGQLVADGSAEKPLLTGGDDAVAVARFLKPGSTSYHAQDVIDRLLS
ncbi:MAG: nitronate monooxygenase [Verrucomicrobia bacterium]|nr:MAG: nitronate monooxygenase [Verrucomicrobiota bacterium]